MVIDLFIMPWLTGQFKNVIHVQNFVGMHPEKAIPLGKEQALIIRIDSTTTYSSKIPPGHIIKQRPPYDTKVKAGRQVWVTISKGPRQTVVPNVLGLSTRQTEITLQKSGLKLSGVTYKSQSSVPKGVVFQTAPPIGSKIKTGAKVQIFVSKGGVKLSLDLTGLSLKQAQIRIKKAGYIIGNINYIAQNNVLPNTILSQHPTKPIYGKPIHLTVSQ